ncbi:7726_t:CDS:2, partial [Scutellospora calospora]
MSSKYSKWVEEALKDGIIAFFDYSVFKDIQQIGKGGFGVIYSADYYNKKVALKCLGTNEPTKEFVNELKHLRTVSFHPNTNQFHGITIATLDKISETEVEFIINHNRLPLPVLTRNGAPTLLSVEPSAQIFKKPSLNKINRSRFSKRSLDATELKSQGL